MCSERCLRFLFSYSTLVQPSHDHNGYTSAASNTYPMPLPLFPSRGGYFEVIIRNAFAARHPKSRLPSSFGS